MFPKPLNSLFISPDGDVIYEKAKVILAPVTYLIFFLPERTVWPQGFARARRLPIWPSNVVGLWLVFDRWAADVRWGWKIRPFDPASSSPSLIVPRHQWFFPLHHFYGLPGVARGGPCRVSKNGSLAAGTHPAVKPSPLWSSPFGPGSPVQRDWGRQIKAGQQVEET